MKLRQILEEHEMRDKSGWSSSFKINGKKIDKEVFEREKKRRCLWKSKKNSSNNGYAISGDESEDEPYLVLEFHRKTVQYIPLPWYKK